MGQEKNKYSYQYVKSDLLVLCLQYALLLFFHNSSTTLRNSPLFRQSTNMSFYFRQTVKHSSIAFNFVSYFYPSASYSSLFHLNKDQPDTKQKPRISVLEFILFLFVTKINFKHNKAAQKFRKQHNSEDVIARTPMFYNTITLSSEENNYPIHRY